MDISTVIAGIKLDSCLMNASGCLCVSEKELDDLCESKVGAVVSKSGTMEVRSGNLLPRLYLDEYGSINSMGLPNLGFEFYLNYGMKVVSKPFIQSIHPFSLDELDIMLGKLDAVEGKRLVEVNISCPNLANKDNSNLFDEYEKYMRRISESNLKNIICGFKLAPIFELSYFDLMSDLLLKYNVKFITCINSLSNGLIVNLEEEETRIFPKMGLGGIGGIYCKPIALSNVYNFVKRLGSRVDVIGCGGVMKGSDVFEYLLCGAKAVQVGTHLVREGVGCFDVLEEELKCIMDKGGYGKLDEFVGKIKVVDSV